MSYETLLWNVESQVATITLNRPERRNAINQTLALELTDALKRAREDDAVRAILLMGRGAGFCAGADIGEFGDIEPRQVRDYLLEVYQPLIGLFTGTEKPIVGAINGTAAGAGASLALACDLRVMSEDASLLMAFINIGLVPDAGATWFLARNVGYSRAFELAIEGKPLRASTCYELGLTNRVVSSDALVETATQWARELAHKPTLAVGLTKRATHHAMEASLRESIEYEAALQPMLFDSEDHREGLRAFMEKRAPDFDGK